MHWLSLLPPARVTALEVRTILLKKFQHPLKPVFFAVKGFGVIGGGAVLFAATGLAGSAILPYLGEPVLTAGSILDTGRSSILNTERSSILNTDRSANMFSILRSIRLGRTWSGRVGWGDGDKELLHNPILQVLP